MRTGVCRTFDVRDILDAYNAVPGMHPIDRNTLVRLMGALVGGWPEGMDEHLTVRLSGRIDRMETRVLADGGECIRLIDYKTGRTLRSNRFSMICSSCAISLASCSPKTGRAVPSTCRNAAYQPKRAIPCRAECGTSQKLRSGRCLQPPLFTDGSLNAEPFTPRYWYKDPNRFFDIPAIDPATPPEV